MKRRLCNAMRSEAGIYIPVFAILLVTLVAVFGLALDGAYLYYRRLQAQRAADSAAIAGAGMISVNPQIVSELGDDSFNYCMEVARVALQNMYAREIIAEGDDSNVLFSPIYEYEGGPVHGALAVTESAEGDRLEVQAFLHPNNRVSVSIDFPAEIFLISALPGIGNTRELKATAEATVRPAIVMLLLDTSNSMDYPDKIAKMRAATAEFVQLFDETTDYIGIVAFGTQAKIVSPLETDNRAELLYAINHLGPAGGATNINDALQLSYAELMRVRTDHPNIYDQARFSIVILSDGSSTAATLDFANVTALPELPAASGSHRYLSFAGDIGGGEPLRPFRLIIPPDPPNITLPDDQPANLDQSMVAPCSNAHTGYNADGTFSGCVNDLTIRIGGNEYLRGTASAQIENFEQVYHLSAIIEADRLRTNPGRPSGRPLNTKFYAVGFGPTVPDDCRFGDNPFENGYGGECAEQLKVNFLKRISLPENVLRDLHHDTDESNYFSYPIVDDDLPLSTAPGIYVPAPPDADLAAVLREIWLDTRLQLTL